MRKNKNYKKLFSFIFMILFLLSFQTIVYSAFSSTMNITGIARSRVETDVRITDFRIASTNNATSSFEEFGKNHIITNVDFKSSSSSITYYLEITNYGSVDVGIFDITGLPSGVNYSIKDYNLHDKICDDSGKCNSFIKKTYEITLTTTSSYNGNVQMNFDFRTYHKVSYTDIENKGYPIEVIDGGNLVITFKENLNRVSILSNNIELGFYNEIVDGQKVIINNISGDVEVVIKKVARLINGSINTVGSEVCIEDECFYIIGNDGLNVKLFSKYNLHIGWEYDIENSKWTEYSDNATGIQNSMMLGWMYNTLIRRGIDRFSSSSWWDNNYEWSYIYNSNSSLYNYVEYYKTYLENLGAEINDARLISWEELKMLGCSSSTFWCDDAPVWVYDSSYWTGSSGFSGYVSAVKSDSGVYDIQYNEYDGFGVRPVIEMSIDEIDVPSSFPVFNVATGNLDTIGSQICIKSECFYVISSDEDSVTMLAKYNLYAGGIYDGSSFNFYGSEATGLQDSTKTGWINNSFTFVNGVIPFSSSSYWQTSDQWIYVYNNYSTLYDYVENYKSYLENQGITVSVDRLISWEELYTLGCGDAQWCFNAPGWLYNTSYWIGSTYYSEYVGAMAMNSGIYHEPYFEGRWYGVRPVIVIAK